MVSPFGSASTVSPLLGAVEESSTSRVVRAPGVPLKSESGRKRSLVVLARRGVVVGEAGGGDVGPRGGSIGLPLPSALSCQWRHSR